MWLVLKGQSFYFENIVISFLLAIADINLFGVHEGAWRIEKEKKKKIVREIEYRKVEHFRCILVSVVE